MQISVALMFRIWTMIAAAAGWLVLVRRSTPETAFLVVMCLGIVLSWVVGLRSVGGLWLRTWASVAFILGTLVVALHTSLVTAWAKPHASERVRTMLAMMTPLALFASVFLLRSWTWAAHARDGR